MAEEDLRRSVDALEARMARIEQMLERVDAALQHIPGVVATVTDAVDEVVAEMPVDPLPEARLKALGGVAERLSDPNIAAQLTRLLDRLDGLEAGMDLIEQAPKMAAIAADAVDEALGQAMARGIDIDSRTKAAAHLAERLTDPDVAAATEALLARAAELGPLLKQLDALPGMLATVGDTVDDALAQAQARGLDLDALLKGWFDISVMASRLFNSSEFTYHIERGVFSPAAVHVVSQAGEAMSSVRTAGAPQPVGPFKALGALRDPDVQRALGFGLEFAKIFGRSLAEPLPPTSQLTFKERSHV